MDADAGCPVDILIDLSEPVSSAANNDEKHEDSLSPRRDSIEIVRRESLSLVTALQPADVELEEQIKDDVQEKTLAPQHSGSDIRLIDDEVFDFDLPISPEKAQGEGKAADKIDEEEVFIGPVGFTEKCIAAGVAEEAIQPLSPLRPEQIAELAKEAYSVAYRIANMKTHENPGEGSAAEPARPVSSCRKLGSLFQQAKSEPSSSPLKVSQACDSLENEENTSPRKRKRSSTFSKNSPSDEQSNSSEKHQRKGTFTKEEPVENVISHNTRSGGKGKKMESTGLPPRGGHAVSKLQPPSKLRRYNNSQPNLAKMKRPVPEPVSCDESATTAAPTTSRRSLQLPRADGLAGKEKGSTATSVLSGQQQTARPARHGIRRAQSLNIKSGLPSTRGSKLAMPSQKKTSASSQIPKENMAEPAASTMTRRSSGIPKGPATKLQLMQPGQLQRKSFAAGRGKSTAISQNGPMKVPAQTGPKMGDTVDRPYNPALAAAMGNSQCPSTPAAQKTVKPKILSLSSEASTPAKSSCSSSSVCGSTPGSVNKRSSLLPTPSKRRASSRLPSSPMSVASSGSNMSKLSLASSSDACDSPVFDPKITGIAAKTRRKSGLKGSCTSSDLDGPGASPFAFKSRKPLVQNTPDLPKRTMSRWSPLRRPKPAALEDQVSMCTKRVTPT